MLRGKKIVIGITGSIAAYKVPFLVRLLVKEGADVQVIMTPVATDFVTPLTLATLSQKGVIVDPFKATTGEWSNHVELGRWADAMVFAPVTANSLGKMVNGIADNFLITAYLSAKCPVFIAPAMDLDMYQHPSTQRNIDFLKSFGNIIIEPQVGELASGLSGPGRMEEPEVILSMLERYFSPDPGLLKKKVLISAGPTYEKIDQVRFIGNFSSGRMGFDLAHEAANRGALVTLVAGPTQLELHHAGIQRIDVESAAQMFDACTRDASSFDYIIMAAAVADFTPSVVMHGKVKKGEKGVSLDLVPTRDILREIGINKHDKQVVVGFALEAENGLENAAKKLYQKNLDYIVLNTLEDDGAGFGTTTNKITILSPVGVVHTGVLKNKQAVACDILDVITAKQG